MERVAVRPDAYVDGGAPVSAHARALLPVGRSVDASARAHPEARLEILEPLAQREMGTRKRDDGGKCRRAMGDREEARI